MLVCLWPVNPACCIHAIWRVVELAIRPGPASDAEEAEGPDYRHDLQKCVLEIYFFFANKQLVIYKPSTGYLQAKASKLG